MTTKRFLVILIALIFTFSSIGVVLADTHPHSGWWVRSTPTPTPKPTATPIPTVMTRHSNWHTPTPTPTPTPKPAPTPTPTPKTSPAATSSPSTTATPTPSDPLSLCDEKYPPLTDDQLARLVMKYFPAGTVPQTGQSIRVTAFAVAMAESSGNPRGCGDKDSFAPNTASVGLWQINTYWNPKYDVVRLFDPDYNAQAAVECSNNGTNWTNWCTFDNGCGSSHQGAYRQFLSRATAAIQAAGG